MVIGHSLAWSLVIGHLSWSFMVIGHGIAWSLVIGHLSWSFLVTVHCSLVKVFYNLTSLPFITWYQQTKRWSMELVARTKSELSCKWLSWHLLADLTVDIFHPTILRFRDATMPLRVRLGWWGLMKNLRQTSTIVAENGPSSLPWAV